MTDYVLSVRAVRGGQFTSDVGATRFLAVPEQDMPAPVPAQTMTAAAWYKAIRTASEWKNGAGEPRGDVEKLARPIQQILRLDGQASHNVQRGWT